MTINKFENPLRLAELDPKNTLIKAGFENGMILCDVGAGSGIFTFAAAEISDNSIYALEIEDNMLELLKKRASEQNIDNIIIKKVSSNTLPLKDNSCDMAAMVTVLHEIDGKENMINEIKRILKEKGRLMIIEFHKRKTKMGPPISHRLSEEFVEEKCNNNGLRTLKKFSLGDNFYALVFEAVT